jgi:hypothetical protein
MEEYLLTPSSDADTLSVAGMVADDDALTGNQDVVNNK